MTRTTRNVVAAGEIDARKLLPGYFEVYEVEIRAGDFGGMPGAIGWIGKSKEP